VKKVGIKFNTHKEAISVNLKEKLRAVSQIKLLDMVIKAIMDALKML